MQNIFPRFFFFKFAPADKIWHVVEFTYIRVLRKWGSYCAAVVTVVTLPPTCEKTYCVNTYFVNVIFASYNIKVCHQRQT